MFSSATESWTLGGLLNALSCEQNPLLWLVGPWTSLNPRWVLGLTQLINSWQSFFACRFLEFCPRRAQFNNLSWICRDACCRLLEPFLSTTSSFHLVRPGLPAALVPQLLSPCRWESTSVLSFVSWLSLVLPAVRSRFRGSAHFSFSSRVKLQ